MRRRDFISLVGGVAAWPITAHAQQPERMPRIGVLLGWATNDPEGQTTLATLLQALQQLGWTEGRNVKIDYRWGGFNADEHPFAAGVRKAPLLPAPQLSLVVCLPHELRQQIRPVLH